MVGWLWSWRRGCWFGAENGAHQLLDGARRSIQPFGFLLALNLLVVIKQLLRQPRIAIVVLADVIGRLAEQGILFGKSPKRIHLRILALQQTHHGLFIGGQDVAENSPALVADRMRFQFFTELFAEHAKLLIVTFGRYLHQHLFPLIGKIGVAAGNVCQQLPGDFSLLVQRYDWIRIR